VLVVRRCRRRHRHHRFAAAAEDHTQKHGEMGKSKKGKEKESAAQQSART
jgi:hypothetical protein